MGKYDAAFSNMENRLIDEARMIPPNMETIEMLLKNGANLNKVGAECISNHFRILRRICG